MTELRPPSPVAVATLTPDNLRAVMTDMGRGPGWYPSADLYRWYVGMAQEEGLKPISQNAFGRSLTAMGYRASIRRFGGSLTRCRFISARAFRGGAK